MCWVWTTLVSGKSKNKNSKGKTPLPLPLPLFVFFYLGFCWRAGTTRDQPPTYVSLTLRGVCCEVHTSTFTQNTELTSALPQSSPQDLWHLCWSRISLPRQPNSWAEPCQSRPHGTVGETGCHATSFLATEPCIPVPLKSELWFHQHFSECYASCLVHRCKLYYHHPKTLRETRREGTLF